MRNFSFAFDVSHCLSLNSSSSLEPVLDAVWVCFGNSLPYEPDRLTPSEQRVVDSLHGWYNRNRLVAAAGGVHIPCWVYHNLNDGSGIACLWLAGPVVSHR